MKELIEMFMQLDVTAFAFAMVFIALDIVTGYAQALANKSLSSVKMRTGLWHKLALVFAIIVAGLADVAVAAEVGLGFQMPIFEAACIYACLMELTSILENLKLMNPELANTKLMSLFDDVNGGDRQ